MSSADPTWRDTLAAALQRAPEELRALASDELHIGGFTNVQLEHPMLDLREVADEALAARALTFFAAAALLRGAALARVHVHRELADAVARHAKRELRGVVQRIDDANVSLLRYFDLYLQPLAEVADGAGTRLAKSVARALDEASRGAS